MPKKECTARFWGDPHLMTFDGLKFDAQPHGEAIFLTQTTSKLEVQGLFEPWNSKNPSSPAVVTAVAFHGPTDDEAIIEVAVFSVPGSTPEDTVCELELKVDGVSQETIYHDTYDEDGVLVLHNEQTNQITIEYAGVLLTELEFRMHKAMCYFSGDVTLLDCQSAKDNVIGLLGSPNSYAGDDWMDQEGNPLPIPDDVDAFFFRPAFEYTFDNWIIKDESNSIFTMDFEDYTDLTQEYDPELEKAILEADEELQAKCHGDIGCIIDGEALGLEAADEFLHDPAVERTAEFHIPLESRTTELDLAADDDLLCVEI